MSGRFISGGISHTFAELNAAKILIGREKIGGPSGTRNLIPDTGDVPVASEYRWQINSSQKMFLDNSNLIIDSPVKMPNVYGNTVTATPRTMFIDNIGNLGGINSIREAKMNINPIDSSCIYLLKPVSYNYRQKDKTGYLNTPVAGIQYGLIAEETLLVNSELIEYDHNMKLSGVSYHKLPALLLDALQKQKIEIESMKKLISTQSLQIATLIKKIDAIDFK